MKKSASIADRVLAQVIWLEWPHVGRTLYLVSRHGELGYVAATPLFDPAFPKLDSFISSSAPNALQQALGVIPTVASRSRRRKQRAKRSEL